MAIGDSSTEGLDDPDPDHSSAEPRYRGWANRLAGHLAEYQGSLLYANLGVRGRTTREIREQQLGPALAMKPNLVTIFSGTNDVVGRRFDVESVRRDVSEIHGKLIGAGAVVLTFTLPDLTPVMPVARLIVGRVMALNAMLREVTADSGARLVDVAAHPVASDPRLWSEDRLHANSAGHARIAAALAAALGLPGFDGAWAAPLPDAGRRTVWDRAREEARWTRRYLAPWIWRSLIGRSLGDGRSPKRPNLEPL